MIKIELLDKSHDRKRFDCGNTQLQITQTSPALPRVEVAGKE